MTGRQQKQQHKETTSATLLGSGSHMRILADLKNICFTIGGYCCFSSGCGFADMRPLAFFAFSSTAEKRQRHIPVVTVWSELNE
jgi:hypothetical protein